MFNQSFIILDINNFTGYKEKRDCYKDVYDYVISDNRENKICALYGLRRTGKTSIMEDVAKNLPENLKEKNKFIQCTDRTDFYDVINFIEDSMNENYRIFFIDEVTYAENFQNIGEVLSDIYVNLKNARIVLTGTDSLGISLLSRNLMYDRIKFVNTTYTSYPEYARLTGVNSILEYMKLGCTLKTDTFITHNDTLEYTETAIVDNMINSLKKSEGIRRYGEELTELYEKSELKNAILRIINKYSQSLAVAAVRKQFRSAPISNAIDTIAKNKDNPDATIKYSLDLEQTNNEIAKFLGVIQNQEMSIRISDYHLKSIYEFLLDMNVFTRIAVYSSFENKTQDKDLEMITHPGMFHSNILYTLECLRNDENWLPQATEEQKFLLIKNSLNCAEGDILENIIIKDISSMLCTNPNVRTKKIDISDSTGRWYVAKLHWLESSYAPGLAKEHEADVIIFDKENKETYLIEVKHSDKYAESQSLHLQSESFLAYVTNNFGAIKERAVLYTGESDFNHDVPRIKTEDFLVTIYNLKNSVNNPVEETFKFLREKMNHSIKSGSDIKKNIGDQLISELKHENKPAAKPSRKGSLDTANGMKPV